jgi:hypothetical protein
VLGSISGGREEVEIVTQGGDLPELGVLAEFGR